MPLTPIAIKKYVARLYQTGTATPTVTVFENTIGNITWTRTGEGVYQGTLEGAFPLGKTYIGSTDDDSNRVLMQPISSTGINKEAWQIYRQNNDTITIQVYDNTYTNKDLSTYTSFINLPEIRVYN